MAIFQLTGLSGAGKTTLANAVAQLLAVNNIAVQIIDGDVYRKTLCKDLGFTKEDRIENIRRLGELAHAFCQQNQVVIIAAINPYEIARNALSAKYNAKTIWVKCSIPVLQARDTKGLYKKANLPENHPEKVRLLTGVTDVFEQPLSANLIIDTDSMSIQQSVNMMHQFIVQEINNTSTLI